MRKAAIPPHRRFAGAMAVHSQKRVTQRSTNADALVETPLPPSELQAIFDALPDVVFFIKDREGRYTHVNLTLVRRLGARHREDLVGKTADQVFPSR
ncbi:PAS domain-containing protein, partial [Algoriphagus aestuarii]|nr:PAS domain-containing protein [Algoriphagus aestuarii]